MAKKAQRLTCGMLQDMFFTEGPPRKSIESYLITRVTYDLKPWLAPLMYPFIALGSTASTISSSYLYKRRNRVDLQGSDEAKCTHSSLSIDGALCRGGLRKASAMISWNLAPARPKISTLVTMADDY